MERTAVVLRFPVGVVNKDCGCESGAQECDQGDDPLPLLHGREDCMREGLERAIDIAVDLGVLPPPLPDVLSLRQLVETAPALPPQIIEGVLHQGCKMILDGTSKSNKSWCLLDLAVSVASGSEWWGRRCVKVPVIYINFELHAWTIAQRLNALAAARPECKVLADGHHGDTLHVWNLRGHSADLTLLRPKLEEQLARHEFGLIILDPAYKVLGSRDENANGEIASLMNELEELAKSSGAAVIVAHHFAKGDSTSKEAMDRMSGALIKQGAEVATAYSGQSRGDRLTRGNTSIRQ